MNRKTVAVILVALLLGGIAIYYSQAMSPKQSVSGDPPPKQPINSDSAPKVEQGMLRITTIPGDAQIFVNGERKGNSPSQEEQTFAVRLPQGDYTVEARKSDGKDYYGKKSVFVSNDSLQTINISLEKVVLPPKPYGEAPNGSVKQDNLEWLRCSIGQSWTGSTCTGEAKEYTFEQAKTAATSFNATGYGGKRDWRLPTIRELQSLRVCSTGFVSETRDLQDGGEAVSKRCNDNASKPTIDVSLFPQTPAKNYWSASPFADDADYAWSIGFNVGDAGGVSRDLNGGYGLNLVRLVR
jgi:Protein of unknown function (DUF1566)